MHRQFWSVPPENGFKQTEFRSANHKHYKLKTFVPQGPERFTQCWNDEEHDVTDWEKALPVMSHSEHPQSRQLRVG